MGGYGSTRWSFHSKKDTVEDCYSLEANRWMREGIFKEGIRTSGGWVWKNSYTGEQTSSIGYEVNTLNTAYCWVRLYYTLTRTGVNMDYKVQLATTHPNFGGLR